MSEQAAPTASPRVPFDAWWAAFLLMCLYILSVVDRGVITMVVDPIKADLHLTDFQISFILGPAFAVVYATLGIPLGWAADRYPRRWVIAGGVAAWSVSVALSGLARSFGHLLAARCGVAAGEASLSPAAYSIIGDKFPKERLTTGLGVYGMGPKLGLSASYAVGAVVITVAGHMGATEVPGLGMLQPWQLALVILGLPGLLAAAITLTMTEPPRKRTVVSGPRPLLLPYLKTHWRLLLPIFLGFTVNNICGGVLQMWVPTYLTRRFGLTAAEYAPVLSAISFLAACTVIFKGMVVDWLFRRGMKDAHIRFYTWLLMITIPPLAAAFVVPDVRLFYACVGVAYVATLSFLVYAIATLQMLAPAELRGQLAALLLLCVSGISPSISPLLVGALTDFVFRDPAAIGASMGIVCVTSLIGSLIILRGALIPIRRALTPAT